MGSIDKYCHLWDGSEPGWTLCYTNYAEHYVAFEFENSGPTIAELKSLRQLVPELRNRPLLELVVAMRGQHHYRIPKRLAAMNAHDLVEVALRAGLTATVESIDRSGYDPIAPDGCALIIEDDHLADQVVQRMLEAKVLVTYVEAD